MAGPLIAAITGTGAAARPSSMPYSAARNRSSYALSRSAPAQKLRHRLAQRAAVRDVQRVAPLVPFDAQHTGAALPFEPDHATTLVPPARAHA
jgi:hypothetical protein